MHTVHCTLYSMHKYSERCAFLALIARARGGGGGGGCKNPLVEVISDYQGNTLNSFDPIMSNNSASV